MRATSPTNPTSNDRPIAAATEPAASLIVALDIRDGRLFRGDPATDPTDVVRDLVDGGVRWLHIADIGAALHREAADLDLLRRCIDAARIVDPRVQVQASAGIFDAPEAHARCEAGADTVVLSSAVLDADEGFTTIVDAVGSRGQLALDVDTTMGATPADWWIRPRATGTVVMSFNDAVAAIRRTSLSRVVVTDVSTDGNLTGPNVSLLRAAAFALGGRSLTASGGIATADHVRACVAVDGVDAVLVGTAIHRGQLTVEAALAALISRT